MSGKAKLSVALFYKEPFAALDWLETAFGFERTMVITNPDGTLGHSQMSFGDAVFMIGGEWADYIASPRSTGGRITATVSVQLTEGLDAHHDRAKAAGAFIIRAPEDQFYGDRTYAARDPEGQVWNFSQTVAVVSREEAEKASGLKIEGWV